MKEEKALKNAAPMFLTKHYLRDGLLKLGFPALLLSVACLIKYFNDDSPVAAADDLKLALSLFGVGFGLLALAFLVLRE